jgi:hypothetical protein
MKNYLLPLAFAMFLFIPMVSSAVPHSIIYKTKADYSNLVPIVLSEDKTRISGYPGIGDVSYNGEFHYPTKLSKGYLLDNWGILPQSAFLNITFEDYSKLEENPSKSELYNMILDDDPFLEMWDCGVRYGRDIEEFNRIIDQDKISEVCVPIPNDLGSSLIILIVGLVVVFIIFVLYLQRKK